MVYRVTYWRCDTLWVVERLLLRRGGGLGLCFFLWGVRMFVRYARFVKPEIFAVQCAESLAAFNQYKEGRSQRMGVAVDSSGRDCRDVDSEAEGRLLRLACCPCLCLMLYM